MSKKKGVPQMLAVANQKGGVGKTITAVSLAAAFAQKKKRVLLVDADFQANASSQLGLKIPARIANKTLAEGIMEDARITKKPSEVIIPTRYEGFDLIAGSMKLSKFSNQKLRPYGLKNWLKKDPQVCMYDIVVFDTHPDLSNMFINVMSASDYYLIPLFAEPDSFDGIQIMFDEIRDIQDSYNQTLYFLGTCITKMDKANKTHRKFKEEIVKLGKRIYLPLLTEIPETKAAAACSDNKIPLPHYRVNHNIPARSAYITLAEKVLQDLRTRRGRTPQTPALENEYIDQVYHQFNEPIPNVSEEGDYVFE